MERTMSITGRLGADPQEMKTNNGIPYLMFRLANNAFGDAEGTTFWLTVTVWDGRCMKVAKTLKKGSLVTVKGDYSDRMYTNKKTGREEIGRDLTATAIYFASAPNTNQGTANPNNARTEAPATDVMPEAPATAVTEAKSHIPVGNDQAPATAEDDLPF